MFLWISSGYFNCVLNFRFHKIDRMNNNLINNLFVISPLSPSTAEFSSKLVLSLVSESIALLWSTPSFRTWNHFFSFLKLCQVLRLYRLSSARLGTCGHVLLIFGDHCDRSADLELEARVLYGESIRSGKANHMIGTL